MPATATIGIYIETKYDKLAPLLFESDGEFHGICRRQPSLFVSGTSYETVEKKLLAKMDQFLAKA